MLESHGFVFIYGKMTKMIEALLTKGGLIWLEISLAIWAIVFKDNLLSFLRGFFGGYFNKPKEEPKKEPEEDKKPDDKDDK